MRSDGTCNRGLAYTDQQPDLTPMPPREPRRTAKPSTAPPSWGERPKQRGEGDRPVVGAGVNSRSNRGNRDKRGGRAAFQ